MFLLMGGRAEGLACADPGARTPIGMSIFFLLFQMHKFKDFEIGSYLLVYIKMLPFSALACVLQYWHHFGRLSNRSAYMHGAVRFCFMCLFHTAQTEDKHFKERYENRTKKKSFGYGLLVFLSQEKSYFQIYLILITS